MTMNKLFVLIFVSFASDVSLATDRTSTSEVVSKVEAKYSKVQTITANFTQVTHSELYGDETMGGDVIFKRPAKMRWNFTGDAPKQFITNGSVMWIYNVSDKTAFRYDDVSSVSGAADFLFQSLDQLDEKFEVAQSVSAGSNLTLNLTPKSDELGVKKLAITFDSAYTLVGLGIVDKFDNKTDLVFSKLSLNKSVEDTTFEFKVPQGVDVLQAGGL